MYSTSRLGTSASGLSGIIQSSSSYVKPARVAWAEKKAPDELSPSYRIPAVANAPELKQVDYTTADLLSQEAVENQIAKNELETPAKKPRRTIKRKQPAKKEPSKKRAVTKRKQPAKGKKKTTKKQKKR